MAKDLKQEFLQLRINKARDEIAQVLKKYDLLLSAELSYAQGGIVPIIKLVEKNQERNKMSEEPQVQKLLPPPVEVAEAPAVEEAATPVESAPEAVEEIAAPEPKAE
jgi:hypothetical protein